MIVLLLVLFSIVFCCDLVSADLVSLQLASRSTPYCDGDFSLNDLQVECLGDYGECYFGTDIRVVGSVTVSRRLSYSATVGVSAYIDGLVNEQFGYYDNVNLCNHLTSFYDDESCPSTGAYTFNVTYTIPRLKDSSSGWWFGYNNKIGVTVDVFGSNDGGGYLDGSCHALLVVTSLSSSFSSSDSRYQRFLYWSLLGLASLAGGVWIGYSVRRKCRVVCLDDLNRFMGDDNYPYYHHDGGGDNDEIHLKTPPSNDIIVVQAAAFEILPELARVASNPITQLEMVQPPTLDQPACSSNRSRQQRETLLSQQQPGVTV